MSMFGMGGGLEFDSKENTRDVIWLGDCDDGCQLLADKLGFGVSSHMWRLNGNNSLYIYNC